MSNSIRFARAFVAVLLSIAVNMDAGLGQEFQVPEIPSDGSAIVADQPVPLQGVYQPVQSSAAQAPGSSRDFAPRSTGSGFGLGPVRPRATSQQQRQLRPEYRSGRSAEDSRILEQLRADNFDDSFSSGAARAERGPQIIRQRYPDGKVQLMRQVMQDDDGNFYNEGPWKLFNRRGELMASGQFVAGLMDGTWERWHAANSGGIFQTRPFNQFEGPFLSTATFRSGKLSGTWVIRDRNQRPVVEVPYKNGQRHGTATWWFPDSKKMRSVNFKEGELDGPLLEWDQQNQLVRSDEFISGRKVVRVTSYFRPKQKSAESFYLEGELDLDGPDSWWDGEPAEYRASGSRVQHGPTAAWHSNGQRKMAGQYRDDLRVGQFVWWHENGTRSLAGRYKDGLKVGIWTWWHENGIKSIEGTYDDDNPVGQWTWWDENGEVRSEEDFGDDSVGELVEPGPSSTGSDDVQTPESDQPDEDSTEQELRNNPPASGIDQMEEIRPVDPFGEELESIEGSFDGQQPANDDAESVDPFGDRPDPLQDDSGESASGSHP